MTEWNVELAFVDDKTRKFWRARVDGNNLCVSFGRIGSDGQTQFKQFESTERCQIELDKLASSKRRKGYQDGDGVGPALSASPPAAATPPPGHFSSTAPDPTPGHFSSTALKAADTPASGNKLIKLALQRGGRKVALQLECTGNAVRTVVVEQYGDAAAAGAAFERLQEAMTTDGYQPVK